MRPLPLILLPVFALAAEPASAGVATAPDVVVYADPTIAATMSRVGAAFRNATGVPVRVFSIPTSLAVALVRQGARDDLLAIEADAADDARGHKLAEAPTIVVHDPVVLAARDGVTANLTDVARASGKIATIDPVSADRLDGPALAASLAVAPGRISGLTNGPDAVRRVIAGEADFALVERADARVTGVREIAVVPVPARVYVVAVSRNAISPETSRFVDYLHGDDTAAAMVADGWELGR